MTRTVAAFSVLAVLVSVHISGASRKVTARIDFDGASYSFERCMIRSETQVIEARDGSGVVRRIPGQAKYSNVVCSRPLTTDKTFWQWRKQIEQGTVSRKKLTIVYLDGKTEIARFTVSNAWPAAAMITKFTAPSLSAAGNEVVIEEIEIAHEGLQRD